MDNYRKIIMYNNTKDYEDFNTEEEKIMKSTIVIIKDLNIKIQNIQKKENEVIKNICDIYINSLDICSFEITDEIIDLNDIIDKNMDQIKNYKIDTNTILSNNEDILGMCFSDNSLFTTTSGIDDIINLLNVLYKLHFYL
jgi:hypothetical protein